MSKVLLPDIQHLCKIALNCNGGNTERAIAWLERQLPDDADFDSELYMAVDWFKRNRDWDGVVQWNLRAPNPRRKRRK